jgi:hypothetical protein
VGRDGARRDCGLNVERAVRAGAKGAFVAPFSWTGKAHVLDVSIALHPTGEPPQVGMFNRFGDDLALSPPLRFGWYHDVFSFPADN